MSILKDKRNLQERDVYLDNFKIQQNSIKEIERNGNTQRKKSRCAREEKRERKKEKYMQRGKKYRIKKENEMCKKERNN